MTVSRSEAVAAVPPQLDEAGKGSLVGSLVDAEDLLEPVDVEWDANA